MKYTYLSVYFLIVLSLILVGCTDGSSTAPGSQVVSTTEPISDSTESNNSGVIPTLVNVMTSGYYGHILAGDKTPYVEFNTKDYERALADGKIIFLYFHSDSNPLSISEERKILEAFNEMENSKIVGFRVRYGDSASDAETQLAKTFGVDGAHTKIILKDGKVKQKSDSSWAKSAYITQITVNLD